MAYLGDHRDVVHRFSRQLARPVDPTFEPERAVELRDKRLERRDGVAARGRVEQVVKGDFARKGGLRVRDDCTMGIHLDHERSGSVGKDVLVSCDLVGEGSGPRVRVERERLGGHGGQRRQVLWVWE